TLVRCEATQKNLGQAAWAMALAVAGKSQFAVGGRLAFNIKLVMVMVMVMAVAVVARAVHLSCLVQARRGSPRPGLLMMGLSDLVADRLLLKLHRRLVAEMATLTMKSRLLLKGDYNYVL
ncbi:hypothetical protein, partial [Pseudomonas avellanae]